LYPPEDAEIEIDDSQVEWITPDNEQEFHKLMSDLQADGALQLAD
jgi:hypothetical protein